MASQFTLMLESLARQRGISAALVISEHDGIVIDAHTQIGLEGDRVAALAASLYKKARLSSRAAGMGNVAFLQLEAPGGRMFAAGAGELVLVTVGAPSVNVGMARLAMLRAITDLAEAAK